MTRKILLTLLRRDFPITILTKSPLIIRDVDLLKKFSDCEVGMTITTLSEDVKTCFEPCSSSISERLAALKTLNDEGLITYTFIGPLLPEFAEDTFKEFAHRLKEISVNRVILDRLNRKSGNWEPIKTVLKKYYPHLLQKYKRIPFFKNNYYQDPKRRITNILINEGLRLSSATEKYIIKGLDLP